MILEKSYKLFIMRHGESLGNLENRFTGLLDVDITEKGFIDAYLAGIKIKNLKYGFDICYTSLLKRAIKTSFAFLESINKLDIKIVKTKYLNERNYGKILGMNKLESYIKYGKDSTSNWLNSYYHKPLKIKKDDERFVLFKNKKKVNILISESLKDVSKRIEKF